MYVLYVCMQVVGPKAGECEATECDAFDYLQPSLPNVRSSSSSSGGGRATAAFTTNAGDDDGAAAFRRVGGR